MASLTTEQLLAEVEDLIRSTPSRSTIRHDTQENLAWLGRLSAVVENWDKSKILRLNDALTQLGSTMAQTAIQGHRTIFVLLHQAQNDLRLRTTGPTSTALGQGMVFAYFDELRKLIELAKQDILFVDPYLEADFVSRYLRYVSPGVTIRLLSEKKLQSLLPAVNAFAQETSAAVEVRSTTSIHDRYVFIDKSGCYQSGASFKDGAKSAATTITQIVDAFSAMSQTYESLWQGAKVVT
ncbi:MAG: hypothetical protein ACYCOR_09735 [Acidobacteriaceae bacterium]